MSEATITLQPATDGNLSYVENLLEENDLPSKDVRSKPNCFYIACNDGDSVGIGGIEIYGTDGFLRSIVVERPARGDGVGAMICDVLETKAHSESVETLYLLTTTVPEFFANRGYIKIEGTDAPTMIQQTTEFNDFCPMSATCMEKPL